MKEIPSKTEILSRTMKYYLIDAFTKVALEGNPCAVVLDADALSVEKMLLIAKEMNQSETAFVLKSKSSQFRARFFTPEREIPLAGHPTIATVHAALASGLISMKSQKDAVEIELNEGPIQVEIEKTDSAHLIRMFQRKPQFFELHEPNRVLPIFDLNKDDLMPNSVIQTVSTGTKQLMIPLKNHDSLKKVTINPAEYLRYRKENDFFSPHLFALGGISSDAQTFARHPGVFPDTHEDAFTGSATGAMAAYLWKYGHIKNPKFTAEQGHWMGRPGRAYVEIKGSQENIESVSVAGFAATVVTGLMQI